MPARKPNFAPPFNIVRASHVELDVRDVAKSRAFYVDCLGYLVSDETQRRALSARHRGTQPPLDRAAQG